MPAQGPTLFAIRILLSQSLPFMTSSLSPSHSPLLPLRPHYCHSHNPQPQSQHSTAGSTLSITNTTTTTTTTITDKTPLGLLDAAAAAVTAATTANTTAANCSLGAALWWSGSTRTTCWSTPHVCPSRAFALAPPPVFSPPPPWTRPCGPSNSPRGLHPVCAEPNVIATAFGAAAFDTSDDAASDAAASEDAASDDAASDDATTAAATAAAACYADPTAGTGATRAKRSRGTRAGCTRWPLATTAACSSAHRPTGLQRQRPAVPSPRSTPFPLSIRAHPTRSFGWHSLPSSLLVDTPPPPPLPT